MNNNINFNIDKLLGEDITQDVDDIIIGHKKPKKKIKIPKNIMHALDDSELDFILKIDADDEDPAGFEEGRTIKDNKEQNFLDDEMGMEEETELETNEDTLNLDDFEFREVATRKKDLDKAAENDDKDKNSIHKARAVRTPKIVQNGRMRVPSKIRTAMDREDDNEYEYVHIFDPNAMENNLINYLDKEEQKIFSNIEKTTKHGLDNASKLAAIAKSDETLKELGVKIDKKDLNASMNDATYNEGTQALLVKKVVEKELKIDTKKLHIKDVDKFTEGIKKVQDMGGNLEGMKVKSLVKVGEPKTTDKEVAKAIYENSNKSEKKIITKEVSKETKKTIGEKTGRQTPVLGKIAAEIGLVEKDKPKLNKKEMEEASIEQIQRGALLTKQKSRDVR